MFDETDPVVRAIQAPFEANTGEFNRRIRDAEASYQDEMDKLDKDIAEREEKLRQLKEGGQPEEPAEPATSAQEFEYDNPLASGQPEARRWPGSPQVAPARQESTPEQDDPWEGGQRRRLRATWTQPDPEPEPEPQPWSAPPPPVRRAARPVSRDDEDYSNDSWLQ